MKILKIKNGYYLDEIIAPSLNNAKNNLLQKLLENINANNININNNSILVINSEQIPIIINEPSLIDKFEKNIIRNIKLNLVFNKETKGYDITYENTSGYFNDANTINYFTSCSDFEPNDLYFHESCLKNFFDNISTDELNECNTFLGIIFYDEQIYDENENLINTLNDQMYFYCYNKETGEILKDESNFNELNKNSDFTFDFDQEIANIKFLHIRKADSFFPLVHQNEDDFISFKNTVNIFLYNQFIESLKQKAVNLN